MTRKELEGVDDKRHEKRWLLPVTLRLCMQDDQEAIDEARLHVPDEEDPVEIAHSDVAALVVDHGSGLLGLP
ncbi:hypothetical protein [Sorangium sp. So ce1389]|uniref:hypothetical protein n=1 Tax=Sorangium sp. So ce1389 TaxID=3133336 RepID=UPI003F62A413